MTPVLGIVSGFDDFFRHAGLSLARMAMQSHWLMGEDRPCWFDMEPIRDQIAGTRVSGSASRSAQQGACRHISLVDIGCIQKLLQRRLGQTERMLRMTLW